MDWLITVPCWGEKYIRQYLEVTLPTVNVALERIDGDIRFIVHTDRPEMFDRSAFRGSVELRPIEIDDPYVTYGRANRDALKSAKHGECVMLTGSDTIVSREFFQCCERRFAEGYRAIFGTAARTIAE